MRAPLTAREAQVYSIKGIIGGWVTMSGRLIGVALLIAAGLAGCERNSPAQLCAASSTFDQLARLMSKAVIQFSPDQEFRTMAEEYAQPERILKVASFHSPVVAAVDRDTGKVDCSALLTMGVPGHEARVFANGYGLVVNDGDETSATFRIQYSVQPAADRSQKVYGLKSASDLGIMAIRAARLASHATDSSQESAAVKQMSSPEEAAPVDASFSAEERQLINEASQAWADFRDGNLEAEKRHSAALDRLLQRNVCWGKINEPQSDYDFHRCSSDSIQKQDGR